MCALLPLVTLLSVILCTILHVGGITIDCVPDDMAALAMEIRMDSGLVGTHMYHLKTYKETLIGKELVQWLVAQKGMSE